MPRLSRWRKCPLEDVRDDLHVPVAVRAETLPRLDPVLVDYPQHAEAHVPRVVVVVEREGVAGVEPAVLTVAPLAGGSDGDHGALLDDPAGLSCRKFRSQLGDVSPLETGDGQLIGRRRPLAPRHGDGRSPVGRPARDFVQIE